MIGLKLYAAYGKIWTCGYLKRKERKGPSQVSRFTSAIPVSPRPCQDKSVTLMWNVLLCM